MKKYKRIIEDYISSFKKKYQVDDNYVKDTVTSWIANYIEKGFKIKPKDIKFFDMKKEYLKKYRNKKSITIYRGTNEEKGLSPYYLTSWSKNKNFSKLYGNIKEMNIKANDNIVLVDIEEFLKYHDIPSYYLKVLSIDEIKKAKELILLPK